MNFFKRLFGRAAQPDLASIINDGALLADVRTPAEFALGHVKGSVNIPLNEITRHLSKFKKHKNIVVFCKSGGRAMMAKSVLKKNGIANVINGRTWTNVNRYVK